MRNRWMHLTLVLAAATIAAGTTPTVGDAYEESAVVDRLEQLMAREQADSARVVAQAAVERWSSAWSAEPSRLATALESLAQVFVDAGDFAAAKPHYERIVAVRAALDASEAATALAHVRLAWCLDELGQRDAARSHEREARALAAGAAADDPALGSVYEELGWLRYDLTDYRGAAADWTASLEALRAQPEPDQPRIIWACANLSHLERTFGNYARAESLQVRAVELGREHLPRDASFATLLNGLGNLYWIQGRLDEAEVLAREALDVSEQTPDVTSQRLAVAHSSLGVLYREQGKLEEAEPEFEEALRRGREALDDDDPQLAVYLNDLALLYAQTSRWSRALATWQKALSLLEQAEVPRDIYHGRLLHFMCIAHLELDEFAAARDRLSEALVLRERAHGADHPDVAATRVALAEAHWRAVGVEKARASGLDAELVRELDRSIAALESTPAAPEALVDGLVLRARLAEARHDEAGAMVDLRRAIDRIEDLRPRRGGGDLARALLLARYADAYYELICLQVDADDVEGALHTGERIRARVLQDRLLASHVDLRHDIPAARRAELEAREVAVRGRIAEAQRALASAQTTWTSQDSTASLVALEHEVDEAVLAYRDLSEEIRLASPTWRRLLQQPRGEIPLARLRRELLADDELILSYQIGPDRSFVLLLDQDQLRAYPLHMPAAGEGAGEPLTASRLEELLEGVGPWSQAAERSRGIKGAAPVGAVPPPEADLPREHLLWRILVPPPVWEAARGRPEVVVIPDAALHELPLEALVVEPKPENPVYWLDAGPPVRYAHSIATLLALEEIPACSDCPRSYVTLSDPTFTAGAGQGARGSVLPPLPGTRRESEELRRAFAGREVVSLQGPGATERALREAMGQARVLHLATHGLVEEDRASLRAALVLTPPAAVVDAGDDGLLHLYEIYELDLRCELTVLSACETKLGSNVRGEGVFALSRGFLAAGAQRTVASLWAVADESTAALMGAFFDGLARAEQSGQPFRYAAVLRDAKREVRAQERWRDPFHWAPFVSSGRR